MARPAPAARPAGAAVGDVTSAKLFQVPQDGHRPSHLGSWWPQPAHSKSVFDFTPGEDRDARLVAQGVPRRYDAPGMRLTGMSYRITRSAGTP